MLYWSDWLQTRYTSLTCGLVEVKKKIPVQFDQNWLIQGLKRFQRYCYIFCVAAVVVCYELQQQAVCCVEHNFSFKESVPTTRHYKYKYQISMYRLILLFKSPLRRWILENVTFRYYFRVSPMGWYTISVMSKILKERWRFHLQVWKYSTVLYLYPSLPVSTSLVQ